MSCCLFRLLDIRIRPLVELLGLDLDQDQDQDQDQDHHRRYSKIK